MWVVELRTRTLYTAAARRLIEIERTYWYTQPQQLYTGSVSNRYKFPPDKTSSDEEKYPAKPGPERPKIAWMKEPLPASLSWHLTHSMVFDILYPATFLFWLVVLLWNLLS